MKNKSYQRTVIDIFLIFLTGILLVALNFKKGLSRQNSDSQSWYNAFSDLYSSYWVDRPLYIWWGQMISKYMDQSELLIRFFTLNCLIYFATSIIFYISLSLLNVRRSIALASVILFQANHISLSWIYQPLPQMIDYLVGAMIMFSLSLWSDNNQVNQQKSKVSLKNIYRVLLFLISISILSYLSLAKPYFHLSILSIILGVLYRKVILGIVCSISLLTTYYIWFYYVAKYLGQRWYSHSMDSQFKQGTWFKEALLEHNWEKIGNNIFLAQQGFGSIFSCLPSVLILTILILIGIILLQKNTEKSGEIFKIFVNLEFKIPARILFACLLTMFIFSFALQGYIPPRITFISFPLWIPFFPIFLDRILQCLIHSKKLRWIVIYGVFCFQILFNNFLYPFLFIG